MVSVMIMIRLQLRDNANVYCVFVSDPFSFNLNKKPHTYSYLP